MFDKKAYHKEYSHTRKFRDYQNKYQKEYRKMTRHMSCKICRFEKEVFYVSNFKSMIGKVNGWICLDCYREGRLSNNEEPRPKGRGI